MKIKSESETHTTVRVTLVLDNHTIHQLSKYKNKDKQLSDLINDYYIKGKHRSTNDGLSKQQLLTRAYYNHRKQIHLEYTKEEFIKYFLDDIEFNHLYDEYYDSNYDKYMMPSFKKHKKLKKVKVMKYQDIMKRNNATPVTIDYYGDITEYPSANSAARAMDMNIITLKKAIKHGYYQDENIRIYYT